MNDDTQTKTITFDTPTTTIKRNGSRIKTEKSVGTTKERKKRVITQTSRWTLQEEDYTPSSQMEILSILQTVTEIDIHHPLYEKTRLLRSQLNGKLQGYKTQGTKNITLDDVKKFNSVYKDVFDLVFNEMDPVKNYKYLVSEYSNRVDDILQTLGEEFIEYIQSEKSSHVKHIPQIAVTVAEHQSQRNFVIDPVITMLSCVYKLQEIIKQ